MRSAEEKRIQDQIYQLQRKENKRGITHETSEHGRLHRQYFAAEAARKKAEKAEKANRKSWW